MEHIEMVEKLTQKADISIAEAKELLESCNWDLLDAMIELEKAGRTYEPAAAARSNESESKYEVVCATASQENGSGNKKESAWRRFCRFVKSLIRKGMDNHFVVEKEEKEVINIPVLLFVIIAAVFFWISVILLLIGLFCGYRYSFRGKELGKENINNGMKKASEIAQNLAAQVKNAAQEHSDD